MQEHKIVHDSVHGSISIGGVFLDLIETAELQRLHDIKQLGLAHLVFPGAHHTRLEHSLGTFRIASLICEKLQIEEPESTRICCAALLHDIGHAPFSHTLEWLLKDRFEITHDDLTRRLIEGKESIVFEAEKKSIEAISVVPEVLERHEIDPKEVSGLITTDLLGRHPEQKLIDKSMMFEHFNGLSYPSQIIHGPIDCDQIDYLIRDSHYTGVAHGAIDLDRLISTMTIHNGDLVVETGGKSAVEGMLVARALMYTSVYFHKTVRIAELMLAKAAENLDQGEIDFGRRLNDSGLLSLLSGHDNFSKKIITSLKYRRLYKSVQLWRLTELEDWERALVETLCNYEEKVAVEEEISRRAGLPNGSVIIDVPGEEILTTEPRMSSVNIGIFDGKRVKPLSRISPLASSLQLRNVQDWALMIACPYEIREKVNRAAKRVLTKR